MYEPDNLREALKTLIEYNTAEFGNVRDGNGKEREARIEDLQDMNLGSSPKCWCKLNSANLSFHKLKHTGFF